MQAKEEPVQTFKGAIKKLKSPNPIKHREAFVDISINNLEAYTNEMLEVLYELAEAISSPGLTSKATIESSFKFFGKTRTPKIVDETTHQAVTALETYLNYLIDNGIEKLIGKKIPNILGTILNGVNFKQIEEDLKNIQKMIAIRKQNYENHKQENINQQIQKLEPIVQAYERVTIEHKKIIGKLKAFDKKLETIAAGYQSREQNTPDTIKMEELYQEVNDLYQDHQQLFGDSIDGEFDVSEYILALALKKSQEKQSQAQLMVINSDVLMSSKKSGRMILEEQLKQEQSDFIQLSDAVPLKISTLNHLSQLKSALVKREANFTELKKQQELLADPLTRDVSVVKTSIEIVKLLEKEKDDLDGNIEHLQKIIKDNGNYLDVVSALSKEYDKQQTPYQQRLSEFYKSAEARLRQLEEAQVLNDKNARKEKITSLQDNIKSSQDAVETLDQKLAKLSTKKNEPGLDELEQVQKGALEYQILQIMLNTRHLELLKLLDTIESQSDEDLNQAITAYKSISKTLKKQQSLMGNLTNTISDYAKKHKVDIKKNSLLDTSSISEEFKAVEAKLNERIGANQRLLDEIKSLQEALETRKTCFDERANTDTFLKKYKAIAPRMEPKHAQHPEIIALKKELDEIDEAIKREYELLVTNKAANYLDANKTEFKGFKERHQEINLQKKVGLPYITSTYFQPNGKFESYLNSRYQTYYMKDWCSSIAAWFLKCYSYKSDATLRQEYISDLKNAFETYKNTPSEDTLKTLDSLIEKGLNDFKPRKKHAEAEDKSLRAVVMALKQDLEHIDIKFNTPQNKP